MSAHWGAERIWIVIEEVRPALETIWPAEGAAEIARPSGGLKTRGVSPGVAAPTTIVTVHTSVPARIVRTVVPFWKASIVSVIVCSPGWTWLAMAVATLGLLLVTVTSSGVVPVSGCESTRTEAVDVCVGAMNT